MKTLCLASTRAANLDSQVSYIKWIQHLITQQLQFFVVKAVDCEASKIVVHHECPLDEYLKQFPYLHSLVHVASSFSFRYFNFYSIVYNEIGFSQFTTEEVHSW